MTFPAEAPRVSVIIPCYNTARFVVQALESVFAQSYGDYEVVVVNDGSPDTMELERVLAPWADRIAYIKTDNNGPSAARNTGIRAARGAVIAFLDSDDVYEVNYLETQMWALDENPSASIVYPRFFTFVHSVDVVTRSPVPRGGEVTFNALVQGICHVPYCAVARREAIERVGLYDSALRSSEDFDLWLRCVKDGSRIVYNERAVLFYRLRPDSLSADPVRICDSATTVLVKMRTAVQTTAEERQVLESAILRFRGTKLFFEGKRAFIAGDIPCAIDKIRQANILLRDTRLRMILLLITTMPHIARTIYLWRAREGK
jgi:glycosyltransferase involved in cell wall biosynthesis